LLPISKPSAINWYLRQMLFTFVGGPLHAEKREMEIKEYFTFTLEDAGLLELVPKITQHCYRAYGDLMIYVEKEELN
jgi:hypothetical protein